MWVSTMHMGDSDDLLALAWLQPWILWPLENKLVSEALSLTPLFKSKHKSLIPSPLRCEALLCPVYQHCTYYLPDSYLVDYLVVIYIACVEAIFIIMT